MRAANSKVVITGGAGFVGYRLGLHIAQHCPHLGQVVLFDLRPPSGTLPTGVESVVGDLCDAQQVRNALKGASVVFHLASYGMSGEEACFADRIYAVNVKGTENVIQACKEGGVGRLVYISTYNAVFDGVRPIVAGTEATTQYVTPATCATAYSLTKAQAEQLVLAANGTPVASNVAHAAAAAAGVGTGQEEDAVLRTCVLRPGGIWGPGEQRHIPRVVQHARAGLLQFVFGDPRSLVDFLHVDNLVAAMLLAAEALTPSKKHIAAGKVYFINDDTPVNTFDHLGTIMKGLGYRWPSLRLPFWLVFYLAWLLEVVCAVARSATGRTLVPMLCRMEVSKCAITHYAQCDLAKRELGYAPVQHSYQDTINWYKLRHYGAVPVPPELVALRAVRTLRAVMALLVVAFLWWSVWRKSSVVAPGTHTLQLDAAEL